MIIRAAKKSFLNQSATLYYTGAKFPSTIALQDLHYFVPYIYQGYGGFVMFNSC